MMLFMRLLEELIGPPPDQRAGRVAADVAEQVWQCTSTQELHDVLDTHDVDVSHLLSGEVLSFEQPLKCD